MLAEVIASVKEYSLGNFFQLTKPGVSLEPLANFLIRTAGDAPETVPIVMEGPYRT
jgi:hypothetical protein